MSLGKDCSHYLKVCCVCSGLLLIHVRDEWLDVVMRKRSNIHVFTQRCKAPKTIYMYKSSREKTVINNICLITVSEVFDRDLDTLLLLLN